MDPITDPTMQYGAFGICVLVIGILGYTVKQLLDKIGDRLSHIQASIDTLPCKTGQGCRVMEGK